jgi:uncharacterized membrane protein ArfC
VIDHVHWWLAALSFALGMALTFTLLVRPANTKMPAWAISEPSPGLGETRKPPMMKATTAEAPPKKILPSSLRLDKASGVSAVQPGRRKPVTNDAVTEILPIAGDPETEKIRVARDPMTEKIPVVRDAMTERIPVAKDALTESIPAARKAPAKKAPASKKAGAKKVPGAKGVPGAKKVPAAKKAGAAKRARPRPTGAPTKRIRTAKESATEKISDSDAPTAVIPLMPYAPYGPGSMRANLDGSGPEGWTVKGRTDSRLFCTPDDPEYDETEAQVWFENEEFAARAFFTPWSKRVRKT